MVSGFDVIFGMAATGCVLEHHMPGFDIDERKIQLLSDRWLTASRDLDPQSLKSVRRRPVGFVHQAHQGS